MQIVFTPSQFAKRSNLYNQLNQLTSAGVGIIQSLEHLAARPPGRAYRRPLADAVAMLHDGSTVSNALRAQSGFLPEFDLALIHAGELSGSLDSSFRLLADYYRQRAHIANTLIAGMAYPALLLHAAVFILPFPNWFLTGDTAAYVRQTFGILVPLYVLFFIGLFAMQAGHSESWRSLIERLVSMVPIVGSGRKDLVLSRLSAALGALLNSGVTVIEAWELAATSSASPAVKRLVRSWIPKLRTGSTPAELVVSSRAFPDLFTSQYAAGEMSGTLDDSLARMQKYYLAEGERKLEAVAQWTPRIIYLMIAGLIAYKILSFWTGYFQQVGEVINW